MSSRFGFRKVLIVSGVLLILLNACQLTDTFQTLMTLDTATPTSLFKPTKTVETIIPMPEIPPDMSPTTAAQTMTATYTQTATMTATMTATPTNTATMTLTATATRLVTPTATRAPTLTTIPSSSDGGCSGGNTSYEGQVVSLINQQRALGGIAGLTVNSSLTGAARAHSQDMATTGVLSHTGSDGSTPFTRMIAYGYSFVAAAENIYSGNGNYNTPSSAVSGWIASDDHRGNIMDATYLDIGVGYWCIGGVGYFTADFGRR